MSSEARVISFFQLLRPLRSASFREALGFGSLDSDSVASARSGTSILTTSFPLTGREEMETRRTEGFRFLRLCKDFSYKPHQKGHGGTKRFF